MTPHLRERLDASAATAAFRDAVARYFQTSGDGIAELAVDGDRPPIKVDRVLCYLLEQHPDMQVERVRIDALAGCATYEGDVIVTADGRERQFRFVWDCAWKATEEGWSMLGLPDQQKAAVELHHRCMREWKEIEKPAKVAE